MKLSDLIAETLPLKVNGVDVDPAGQQTLQDFHLREDTEIRSIHYRSQEVRPGGVFVAIEGHSTDGHRFVDDAVENGADVIVCQKPLHHNITTVEVENSRKALSRISARFYRDPSEKLFVIGITGTNGKTTTAYLIESILVAAGLETGVIGTINYRYRGRNFENPVTTPESLELHAILAEMLSSGITHVVLEVSSHAVDLFRVHDCRFDVGIFTNLTQDHLDYHGDMETYWSCKRKFFTDILAAGSKKNRAAAVINCENAKGRELAGLLETRLITTGHAADHMIRPLEANCGAGGISAEIATPAGEFVFKSALPGKHNLDNILAAAGTGIVLGIPPETIRTGIEALDRVPGRFERILNDTGRNVFVDYAHTPDALENALSSLQAMTKGRLICVFGCGGDRDTNKRPLMGKIAVRYCDLTIVTSDNPRTEAPLEIIRQITDGIRPASAEAYAPGGLQDGFRQKGFCVEPDRRKAITLAVMSSEPEDTILIAGKGHETYQIVGKAVFPFDDRVEVQAALLKLSERSHASSAGRSA